MIEPVAVADFDEAQIFYDIFFEVVELAELLQPLMLLVNFFFSRFHSTKKQVRAFNPLSPHLQSVQR